VTHSPLLVGSEGKMAGIFERVLNSPRLPAAAREANWPPQMQHEWTEHQAGRAASAHRHRAVEGLRAVRAALDAFNPDFILIWGDDQYEKLREDGVAPFCVFALDEIDSHPFRRHGASNAWGEPADTVIHTLGHRAGGRHLAASIVEQDFDVNYAYKKRHEAGLPHSRADLKVAEGCPILTTLAMHSVRVTPICNELATCARPFRCRGQP
jgi:hypothetical protein